jgi:CRP/FNR family cyclic AMP-dependent transcriptional regulator
MTTLIDVTAFKGMDPIELDRIEGRSRLIVPRDGARIFGQGDAADAVYAIVAGEGDVRIGAIDRNSKGLMIENFHVGDLFGEIAVLDGSTRTADAVAEGRVSLLRITSHVFLETLNNNAAFGANMCHILAARLRRTSGLFQDATFANLEARLARQILYLANYGGRRTDQGLRLAGRFRQADLADLLGATTRSIITILNVWRASGLVVYDPIRAQLTLCREQDLRALVNLDHGASKP